MQSAAFSSGWGFKPAKTMNQDINLYILVSKMYVSSQIQIEI